MKKPEGSEPHSPPAFLLAQLGAHGAARFAERLSTLGLAPPHAGILRLVGGSDGMSQQQLAIALNIHPSRLVAILDELETRGLVERRGNPDDRRVYAVSLTEEGKGLLQRIAIIGREHNSALLKALKPSEREELASLLQRIADEQGLTRGVHPGFARWAGRARTRGPEER